MYPKFKTRNGCYIANRKIASKGIMIHSTATLGVMAGAWLSRWNKSFRTGEINRQVCVHAFLDDKERYLNKEEGYTPFFITTLDCIRSLETLFF